MAPVDGSTCEDIVITGAVGTSTTDGQTEAVNTVTLQLQHYVWDPEGGWEGSTFESAETHGGAWIANNLSSARLDLGTKVPLSYFDENGSLVPSGTTATASARYAATTRAESSFDHFRVHGDIVLWGSGTEMQNYRIRPAAGSVTLNSTGYETTTDTTNIDQTIGYLNRRPTGTAGANPHATGVQPQKPGATAVTDQSLTLTGDFGTFWMFRQTSTNPAVGEYADFGWNDLSTSLPASSPEYQLTLTKGLANGSTSVALPSDDSPVDVTATFTAAGPLTTASTFSNSKSAYGGAVYREHANVYWQQRDEKATVTIKGVTYPAAGTLTTSQATVTDR
jgi:hypothetical protein